MVPSSLDRVPSDAACFLCRQIGYRGQLRSSQSQADLSGGGGARPAANATNGLHGAGRRPPGDVQRDLEFVFAGLACGGERVYPGPPLYEGRGEGAGCGGGAGDGDGAGAGAASDGDSSAGSGGPGLFSEDSLDWSDSAPEQALEDSLDGDRLRRLCGGLTEQLRRFDEQQAAGSSCRRCQRCLSDPRPDLVAAALRRPQLPRGPARGN